MISINFYWTTITLAGNETGALGVNVISSICLLDPMSFFKGAMLIGLNTIELDRIPAIMSATYSVLDSKFMLN